MRICDPQTPQVQEFEPDLYLLRYQPEEAGRLLPLLWGYEREYGHCSQPCEEAPWDSIPLWRLLWQDLQEATVLVQPHVVLPANRHSLNGEGFSEE